MAVPEALPARDKPFVAGGAMLQPVCLLALGLWWLNDDVLKPTYHNFITGKLSDVACLVVFPVLVLSLVQVAQSLRRVRWEPSRGQVLTTVLGVGLLFAGINLSATLGELYKAVFFGVLYPFSFVLSGPGSAPIIAHTQDATDLLALPALYFAYRLAPRRARGGVRV